MISSKEVYLCLGTLVLLTGYCPALALDDSSSDDTSVSSKDDGASKPGRGLQMLRLGKRLGRSVDDQDSSHLSTNEVQGLLASLFGQPRDESRRQPPLPRYGRDSNSNINSRFLVDAVSDDSGIYPSDFFTYPSHGLIFRPAPRGGRYRRDLSVGRISSGNFLLPYGLDRIRSIGLPTFDDLLSEISRLQPKAVPRPRIGRFLGDQADGTALAKS